MEIDLQNIVSENGALPEDIDEAGQNVIRLNEIISSLEKAFSTLQVMQESETNQRFESLRVEFPEDGVDLLKAKKLYEASLVKQALRQTGGHQSKAAKLLRIRATTLNSIIKRHGIET